MSRFAPIPPSAQTPEQRKIHDEIESRCQTIFGSSFTWKNEEGALLGPFSQLLYNPTIALPWLHLSDAGLHTPSLSLREREVAILSVCSYTKAAFATYAHIKVAHSPGLSETQTKSAIEGEVPGGLGEREEAVFVFAKELSRMRGPLEQGVWKEAEEKLGREGAGALLHLVGNYLYTGVLLNGADVPVPREVEEEVKE